MVLIISKPHKIFPQLKTEVVYVGPEIMDTWERFHAEKYASSGGIGFEEFIQSLGFKKVKFQVHFIE